MGKEKEMLNTVKTRKLQYLGYVMYNDSRYIRFTKDPPMQDIWSKNGGLKKSIVVKNVEKLVQLTRIIREHFQKVL